jgi:hypothetical protein
MKAVQASSESDPPKHNRLKVWVPIVGIVALAALAVGVVGLMANRPKSDAPLRAEISHLQGELSGLNQRLASDEATISSIKASSQASAVSTLQGQVSTLQGQLRSTQNQLQKFQVCVPELQQEINGMNVNTSNTGGFLTSAFIDNPTIISTTCSKTLNGS